MWSGGGFSMGMGGGFGMIIGVLFWVLLIVAVVVIVMVLAKRSGSSKTLGFGSSETALDVLKKRYANGEIGKQEFEEKKRDLQE